MIAEILGGHLLKPLGLMTEDELAQEYLTLERLLEDVRFTGDNKADMFPTSYVRRIRERMEACENSIWSRRFVRENHEQFLDDTCEFQCNGGGQALWKERMGHTLSALDKRILEHIRRGQ